MMRLSSLSFGWLAPRVVGAGPRYTLLASAAFILGVACSNGSSSTQQLPPVDLGMTSNMAAYYSDENTTIYEAQLPVQLPVRKPTATDLSGLGAKPANTGYPRAPYLTVGDESLEVSYTITNIDSQSHSVWLCFDPWNEFVRWDPGVTVVSDEDTEPNWGYDLVFIVPSMSRVTGDLTQDDMHEMAIKLASVENLLASPQAMAYAASMADAGGFDDAGDENDNTTAYATDPTTVANNIFNPQNRSNGGDPLYTPWIPSVVAGLTGFDLGLRTYEQANVAVEILVNVDDLSGDRFVVVSNTSDQLGPPTTTLKPPGALD
jgi:hypothetical protein